MPAETFTIQFKPSGHTDLINAINALSAAQKKLEKGVATTTAATTGSTAATKGATAAAKQAHTVYDRLTAKLTAHGTTWKALGVGTATTTMAMKGNLVAIEQLRMAMARANKTAKQSHTTFDRLTAKIKAHGQTWKSLGVSHEIVKKAIRGELVALEQLRMAMGKASASGMLAVRNNRLLANSFATLRSKLLLFSFGAMLVERAIVSMVRAYGVQEAANIKLRQGLANVRDTTAGVTQRLIDYSSALQKLTAFGDEAITTGMVQFTTFGLNEKAIKALTPQVLNVARAIQSVSGQMPELNSLFIAFGKATTTGIGTLTRYGVVLSETERAQLSLAEANESAVIIAEILERQYGGLAEAYAKTTAGMLDLANLAIGDATEKIGEAFAPTVLKGSEAVQKFAESLTPTNVKQWSVAIGGATAATYLLKAGTKILGKTVGRLALALARTPWGLAIAGVGALLFGIFKLTGAFRVQTEEISDADKALIDAIPAMTKLQGLQEKGAEALAHRLRLLQAIDPVEKILIGLKHEASDAERKLAEEIVKTTLELELAKEAERERARAIKASASAYKSAVRKVNAEIAKQKQENERLFPTQVAYREEMEKARRSGEHMQGMLAQYIMWLDREGITHNLVTDAMKKAKEEQDALNASTEEAIKITIAYNAHMKKQFEASDALDVIAMERKHLLDGEVSIKEKLALHSLKVAQAEERLKEAMAMGAGNLVAQVAAEKELLNLRKEFIGLDPERARDIEFKAGIKSINELVSGYENQLAIMKETDPVQKELIRIANEQGMNYKTLQVFMNMNIEGYRDLKKAIEDVVKEQERQKDAMLDVKRETLAATIALYEQFDAVQGLGLAFSSFSDLDFSAFDKLTEAQKALADAPAGDVNAQLDAQIALQEAQIETKQAFYGQLGDMAVNFLAAEAARNETAIRNQLNRELTSLRASRKYKRASDKKKQEMEDAVKRKAQKEFDENFNMMKALRIAAVVIDTASAMVSAASPPNPPLPISAPFVAMAATLGAVQLATILAQKPPKAEHGGLIGGRLHTQGGTMINAEAGEFIMSRSAVESVGLENLNRMNEGAEGGTVTVNVSGNVLTQDFVEGELAENIKEAIRRGTDFGIS